MYEIKIYFLILLLINNYTVQGPFSQNHGFGLKKLQPSKYNLTCVVTLYEKGKMFKKCDNSGRYAYTFHHLFTNDSHMKSTQTLMKI